MISHSKLLYCMRLLIREKAKVLQAANGRHVLRYDSANKPLDVLVSLLLLLCDILAQYHADGINSCSTRVFLCQITKH